MKIVKYLFHGAKEKYLSLNKKSDNYLMKSDIKHNLLFFALYYVVLCYRYINLRQTILLKVVFIEHNAQSIFLSDTLPSKNLRWAKGNLRWAMVGVHTFYKRYKIGIRFFPTVN